MVVTTGKFRINSIRMHSGIGINTIISKLLAIRTIADPLFSKAQFAL